RFVVSHEAKAKWRPKLSHVPFPIFDGAALRALLRTNKLLSKEQKLLPLGLTQLASFRKGRQ
ncbi:MAG: hypothetical protein N3B10_15610, partial [Armatimonadetes bacterium]|nr:hypothetical protein [Armatimonadota bacterium]